MYSVFFKVYKVLFLSLLILCLFFIPIIISVDFSEYLLDTNTNSIFSSYDFMWPIPGYTKISSYFGRRNSPTLGASSYHSGIDIPAPEGTNLYAIADGYVTFSSWGAGGGYTITYVLNEYPDIKISYCHVSPIMFVSNGDFIKKGQILGTVGPKNIYNIQNNPYKDSTGNPTNGASTGCHLHFTLKENNNAVNPLNYYSVQ